MEITNEIKFKVALQYYGQPFLVCYNIENNPVIERFEGKNADLEMYEPDLENKRELLILRPLSEITDEDAIECLNILMATEGSYYKDWDEILKNQWLKIIKLELTENFGSTQLIIKPYFKHLFLTYQYLILQGYDLPNYLLGGKTLFESGLAIYEHEMKEILKERRMNTETCECGYMGINNICTGCGLPKQ